MLSKSSLIKTKVRASNATGKSLSLHTVDTRRIKYRRLYKEIRGREVKFAAFRDGAICHSKEVFTQDSLNRLAKEYQLYITGSDKYGIQMQYAMHISLILELRELKKCLMRLALPKIH